MKKFAPKTYFIKTFGCQANIADSGNIAGILESLGFEEVSPKKNLINETEILLDVLPRTDLFIINTCSVRQKSEDKAYGIAKILKDLYETPKYKGKRPFTVMAGCMVGSTTGERSRYKFEELKLRTPWVNTYIDSTKIFELPAILKENKLLDEWAIKKYMPDEIHAKLDGTTHAFVNISNGCDNFCTYCVVPYARGKEVSRSKEDIIREIDHLLAKGVTEVTLCGQNVNSWGLEQKVKFKIRAGSKQKLPFAALLRELHQIEGLEKISFISSNPFDFTDDLIKTLALPKISNYLHIAVQSGSNEVLKNMNRRHTIEDFIGLVKKIKKERPDIELGTDIIVGFPGESEAQFMDTVELFKKIKFNIAYISMYSPRKGTNAQKFLSDDVPQTEKKRRHAYLTGVWRESLKN